jgi:predicted nucleotidyltransferase
MEDWKARPSNLPSRNVNADLVTLASPTGLVYTPAVFWYTWRMKPISLKATQEDRAPLEAEAERLAAQLQAMGAVRVILFGSLARGQVSLFSDIDQPALFERDEPARELTRWVYGNIHTGEAVDILAYGVERFEQVRDRPFFRKLLHEGKVLHGSPALGRLMQPGDTQATNHTG